MDCSSSLTSLIVGSWWVERVFYGLSSSSKSTTSTLRIILSSDSYFSLGGVVKWSRALAKSSMLSMTEFCCRVSWCFSCWASSSSSCVLVSCCSSK